MEVVRTINLIFTALFIICYAYQFCYLIIAVKKKPEEPQTGFYHRYAVVIAARNEEKVIGQLIESVRNQSYPSEMIDIFVVADNCTDSTARTARKAGAFVWERENPEQTGKGYALQYVFNKIMENHGDRYDGFFILDADNLLDENYISEMNKTFSCGYGVVTGYRNSKNPGSSWISTGYALHFMRESAHLNAPRMELKTACKVTGTGFLISREIVLRNNGWRHFLLTEDFEFTVDCILRGDKMGYCRNAVFYDEQPVSFKQSWDQRLRWAKGYLQVFKKYGGSLFRGIFGRDRNKFACFDMMMSVIPAITLTTVGLLLNITTACTALFIAGRPAAEVILSQAGTFGRTYMIFLFLGITITATQWDHLKCGNAKKIYGMLMFPFFMISYIPIAVYALLPGNTEWRPVRHDKAMTLRDIRAA